jgi:hypothetical protein
MKVMRATLSPAPIHACQLHQIPKSDELSRRVIGNCASVVLVIVALVVGLVAFAAMAVARHD